MAEKDIAEKTLMAYEDVFADIINVLLFNGKEVVTPESLKDAGIKSQYKADGNLHEMERDSAKIWQVSNVTFALIGLENQTKSEKDMPFRIIGYDGSSYRSQLLNGSKERYPVITIVLYFGKSHWNQPKNLRKVLSVPEELINYFNDYKLNVFEISWLSDEQVNMFKSDFKAVADYFTQMRKNNSYKPTPQTLKHIDEFLKLLSVFGEDKRFADAVNICENGRKVSNMCEWLDIVEKENQAKGFAEGVAEGVAEGRIIAIQNLLRHGFSEEAILSLEYSKEEYLKAQQLLMQTV